MLSNRAYEQPNADACWDAATNIKQIKPPERGMIMVTCAFEDLGPTQ